MAMGKFIAFEGIDGSGKTTQFNMLIKRLADLGIKCYGTKEPTGSPIGSLIRQILSGRIKTDARVLANLFAADRADHLLNETDGIYHKIKNGTTIISDRYYFSSYAFQGIDMDMDWIININAVSYNILRPSITIFLDVPAKTAIERIEGGRFHTELFETEERLELVREKYFEAFDKLKDIENVAIIDADADADVVADRIWEVLVKNNII
jgi:dTMP kinase